MTHTFSPQLDSLIQDEMARGNYASVDDLLLAAVHILRDRSEAIEGIREGIEDLESGRYRMADDVLGDLRARHGLSGDA